MPTRAPPGCVQFDGVLDEYRRCSRHWAPVLQKFAEGACFCGCSCVCRASRSELSQCACAAANALWWADAERCDAAARCNARALGCVLRFFPAFF